jgi:hypothetical protein
MRGVCTIVAALLAILAASGVAACRPAQAPTPASSAPSATAGEVVLATPQDATRSLLTCLRAQRAARARHDGEAVKVAHAQLRALAAQDAILRQYETALRGAPRNPERELDTFVDGWGPIIGYYADGLQLAQMSAPQPTGDPDQVHVLVPATSPAGGATIRIECRRGADRQWRVARVDFAAGAPSTRPATTSAP